MKKIVLLNKGKYFLVFFTSKRPLRLKKKHNSKSTK